MLIFITFFSYTSDSELHLSDVEALPSTSNGRDGHHDPAEIPQQMETLDAHTQDDVHADMYEQDERDSEDYVAAFRSRPTLEIKLSQLKRIYEMKDKRSALSLLADRHKVFINPKYLLDFKDPNVLTLVGPHHLDFTLYVGDRIGLDVVLPNLQYDHAFSVYLSFNRPNILFPSSDIKFLPFNPNGRMVKIGKRNQESIWLAMVPSTFLLPDHSDNLPGRFPILDAPTTALKPKHALMLTMFFSWALASMRFRDLHCITPYPTPLTRESVKASTDIL
jgi:hypothetical protein